MRKPLAVSLLGVAVLLAARHLPQAHASENPIGSQNDGGNLTRCFVPGGSGNNNITFQCPGEAVYACAGYGGFRDAGPGCLGVNFNTNPDSYAFPLARNLGQDRICLRDFDAGVLNCDFFQVAK